MLAKRQCNKENYLINCHLCQLYFEGKSDLHPYGFQRAPIYQLIANQILHKEKASRKIAKSARSKQDANGNHCTSIQFKITLSFHGKAVSALLFRFLSASAKVQFQA